jgi:hypothetical protein
VLLFSLSEKGLSSGVFAAIGVISTLLAIAALVIIILVLRKQRRMSSESHVDPPPEETYNEVAEPRDYDKLGDRDTDHYQELPLAVTAQPPQDKTSGYINQGRLSAVTTQTTLDGTSSYINLSL